jgi:uncharacterized protein YbaR (Trm112 family)
LPADARDDKDAGVEALRPEILAILACPVPTCHGRLEQRGDHLRCARCGLRYRIEERWPVLIPEEALPPESGERSGDGPPAVRND